MKKHTNLIILILLLAFGILFVLLMPPPFSGNLTKADFRAYWGASYLLARSENFSDAQELLLVQQEHTGIEGDTALKTWNPPWLLAWLIPYALLNFERASWLWFLTNIILILVSVSLLWELYTTRPESRKKIGFGLAIAFTFSATLTTLFIGQITTIILFGLSLFLFLERRNQYLSAGAALALATIKLHLVYITLPLVFLALLRKRQWKVMVGFSIPIILGTAVALWLRPSFPLEYVNTVSNGNLLQLTVPTLGFFLYQQTGWYPITLMGVIVLPLAVAWQYQQRDRLSMVDLVCATLPLSIVTSPFGWSFDVIILLIPLIRLAVWGAEGRLSHVKWMFLVYIAANTAVIVQRGGDSWDYKLFWFPIVLAGLYYWGWLTVQDDTQRT